MTTDPSDDEIEAILLRASPEQWAALWEAVDAVDAETEHAQWGGGQQIDTTVDDAGDEHRVFEMPYVTYSDAVRTMVQALYTVGAVLSFNWPDWDGRHRYRGGEGLHKAPVADAVRYATAIVRNDRFSEGALGSALNNGILQTALRRLRHWYDVERPQTPAHRE